ncbi:MAG: hypothetical protein OHK0022_05350 [Roseiflexaceae bacterium]
MKHATLLVLLALWLSGCGAKSGDFWPSTLCPEHNTEGPDDVCLITHPYQNLPVGQALRISSASVASDGRWVALGGMQNANGRPSPVLLVDLLTGMVTDYEAPVDSSASPVALSPDNRMLAAAVIGPNDEHLVRVWTLTDPPTVLDLSAQTRNKQPYALSFSSVVFTPDSRTVIAGRGSSEVVLWDATSGALKNILSLPEPDDEPTTVTVSVDGTMLAVASRWSGPLVTVFDVRSGALLHSLDVSKLDHYQGWPQDVAFSPDGSTIAVPASCQEIDCEGVIWLWDLNTGQTRPLRGHIGQAYSVIFHPDGRWLASGGGDDTIRIWDWRAGTEIDRLDPKRAAQMAGRTPPFSPWSTAHQMSITANGDTLVFTESAGQARVWRLPERLWR